MPAEVTYGLQQAVQQDTPMSLHEYIGKTSFAYGGIQGSVQWDLGLSCRLSRERTVECKASRADLLLHELENKYHSTNPWCAVSPH